jgi:hypothetical protein
MLSQIVFAVVMMFSAVAAATREPAALYVYSVGGIATVILDGQELARIRGNRIFGVKITPGQHRFELRSADKTPEPLVFNFADKDIYIRVGDNLGVVGTLPARLKGAELGGSWMLPSSARKLGRKMPKKCSQLKIPTSSTGISSSYQTGDKSRQNE